MAAAVFDTSIMLLVLNPEAKPPIDPETEQPLEHAKQRVDYLIRKLSKAKTQVVVPSPALSELLVHAGAAVNDYVSKLHQSPFTVAPFDTRAAIECAQAISKHGIRSKGTASPRAKIKFDRQIVAIAQVSRAETIYSDDADIFAYGKQAGIKVVRSYELELDPDDLQRELDLNAPQTPDQPDATGNA